MGPVLEGVVNGLYYWIPFACIHKILIEEPQDLRDVVWTPVHFEWSNGGEAVGMIPTRYAGSQHHEEDLVRLARKTVWRQLAPEVYAGFGQRMFATDAGGIPADGRARGLPGYARSPRLRSIGCSGPPYGGVRWLS